MIEFPSSLDWLESLFNIEEEKEDIVDNTGVSSKTCKRTTSSISTAAANSGVQTSVANSPQSSWAANILATESDYSTTTRTSSSILDIDPNLMTMLLQITDSDISSPMNSFEQRSDRDVHYYSSSSSSPQQLDDELALGRMKAEAAKDFNEWKQTKRLIKRLSRHDSTLSVSSSSPPTKKNNIVPQKTTTI